MGRKLEIEGQKFGKLTVLNFTHVNKHGKRCFDCLCDCGIRTNVVGASLTSGLTTSCGCVQKSKAKNVVLERCIKHPNQYFFQDSQCYFTVMDKCETIFKVFIDFENIEKCKQYQWKFDRKRYVRNSAVGYLHRFLLNAPDDMVVDHINHNPLDNRMQNIRLCTRTENMQNRKSRGYVKNRKKYCSAITVNKHRISLGSFITKDEAIAAKRKAEKEYFKDFAYRYQE